MPFEQPVVEQQIQSEAPMSSENIGIEMQQPKPVPTMGTETNLRGAVVSAFNTVITSASNQLCTGTPTASFAAIFNSLGGGGDVAEATATQLTDLYPSETAVSLYYTASGNQGVGAITGSATGATKTGGTSASVAATGSSSASGV
ncbi:hypothetical protein BPOR_0228g00090 [Botrytis porri]|uniref:Uncharacterized protein n=1 Tax=Botrytis porri TaxID=87229 RepID=A0A4Z1KMU4_9HELO|nr:hypothetical protein BPOR_0228g00090 [Botrytis porri]